LLKICFIISFGRLDVKQVFQSYSTFDIVYLIHKIHRRISRRRQQ